jgi:integrase
MRRTRPGRQNAALPPELAAHPDDSAAYEDWRAWRQRRRTWLTGRGRLSYRAEYLFKQATTAHDPHGQGWTLHKPSTIRRRLASISVAHQVAGFDTPTADAGVRAVWSGIRRRQGMAPRKVRAARTKVITAMVAPLGEGLADARDRTLLLFGFAGALRRSELVALDVEDVSEDDAGLRLVLRKSKTDQEAEGAIRGLPYGSHPATCPVRAWRRWLDVSGIQTGAAFRSVSRHGHLGTTPQRPGSRRHRQTTSPRRRPGR